MSYSTALIAWALAGGLGGLAFGDVGIRDFADTILVDDPEPNDQLVGPTTTWRRFWPASSGDPSRQVNLGFELSKRITPGGTGSSHVGADRFGTTTPTLFVAKGLGDLPIGVLRPLAVTGQLGYAISDTVLRATSSPPADDGVATGPVPFNGGHEHRWTGGFTVQYPLGYLDGEVMPLDLPIWLDRLTPVVEVAWSSPASKPSQTGTQWIIAPGLIWSNGWYQLGAEALIPGNPASGRGVGAIAQFRMALGVIAPALNRPLFPSR